MGPCPIIQEFVQHCLIPRSFLFEEDVGRLRRFEFRPDDWAPVLETRAFVSLLLAANPLRRWLNATAWLDDSARLVDALQWDLVRTGDALGLLDSATEGAHLEVTNHKLLGSPLGAAQIKVENAARILAALAALREHAVRVHLFLNKKLVWPPLPFGAALADELTRHGYSVEELVEAAMCLSAITKENQASWRRRKLPLVSP